MPEVRPSTGPMVPPGTGHDVDRIADWAGRTALVTGASRGIGRALAVGLGGRGATLTLLGRDHDALAATVAAVTATAPAGTPVPRLHEVDLADPPALQAALPAMVDGLAGRLDLLANVAGASRTTAPLEALEDDDWESSLALHLLAPVRLQRACFDVLCATRGVVVSIGSIAGAAAPAAGAPYAVAKAALTALGRSTAVEWARHGVRSVVVEPGYVDTSFNDELVASGAHERLLQRIPTRRAIDADEVARLVIALADPALTDLTGGVVRIDGGLTARL